MGSSEGPSSADECGSTSVFSIPSAAQTAHVREPSNWCFSPSLKNYEHAMNKVKCELLGLTTINGTAGVSSLLSSTAGYLNCASVMFVLTKLTVMQTGREDECRQPNKQKSLVHDFKSSSYSVEGIQFVFKAEG